MHSSEKPRTTHSKHRPWGCAILSFICGVLALVVLIAILFVAIPAFDTGAQLPPRPTKSKEELTSIRDSQLQSAVDKKHLDTERLVERVYARQQQDPETTMNFLVLSGGGEHGAFGSGFLLGWSSIKSGDFQLPKFDGVTGVSAGSYIAPYAYLGTRDALETIDSFFRNPKPDWAQRQGMFFFQPANASFATVAGLQRDLDAQMTVDFAKRIDEASTPGRLLLVQATNVDEGITQIFNFGATAKEVVASGHPHRLSELLLASSAIPVLFPPREIDGSLYVDGSVGGNFYAGGRPSAPEHTFGAVWKRKHPEAPIPTTRYWVVINGTLRQTPGTVQPTWPSIAESTIEISMGSSQVFALQNLYALGRLTELRGDGKVEVRWIALPEDFKIPSGDVELFDETAMRAMSDEGKRLGADPDFWKNTAP